MDVQPVEKELPPGGCLFWWYSIQAWFYRRFWHFEPDAWQELVKEGWYFYYTKNHERHGYVLTNGIEETEPQEFETFEEFMGARERFAEKELKNR